MREDILDQILAAQLSDRTALVAIELLRLAGESGQVNTDWPAFCRLCGTETANGARRYLTALQDAGLIHYSTNDWVYVTWKAYLRTQVRSSHLEVRDHDDAMVETLDESAPGSANVAPGSANVAPGSANVAPGSAATSHARGGWLVGRSDPLPDHDQPTNQPTHARGNVLADGVPELLADPLIGFTGKNVRAAMGLPFEQVLMICIRWRVDMDAGRCTSIGSLIYRLRFRYEQPALTDLDRKHELYRRHGQAIERERQRQRYVPEEYRDIILGHSFEEARS